MHCTRFNKFSETRWAAVSATGRRWILGMVVGTPAIFKMCEADQNVHMSELGGFTRCSPEVRKYLALCGMGTIVANTVALELLRDDRWLLRAPEILEKASEEMNLLLSMPAFIWHAVARVCDGGFDGRELKACALQVANISMAYIHRECVSVLSQEPWCHAQGDIEANVQAIGKRDPSTIVDYTTLQIRRLLGLGVPVAAVVRALRLLQHAPFSTTMVEQSHGGGATILRQHRQFSPSTLCAASLMHQTRFMSSLLPEEKVIAKLTAEIDRLESYKARFGARQVFFGQAVAKGSAAAHRHPFSDCTDFQTAMEAPQRASDEFKKLSVDETLRFQLQAENLKRRRLEEKRHQAQEKRERRSIEEERLRGIQSSNKAMHVENFKFTERDCEEMAELLRDPAFQGLRLEAFHEGRLCAPLAPSLEERMAIEDAASQTWLLDRARAPWWCHEHVGRNRSHFEACALGVAGGTEFFLFLYAFESPRHSTFLRLRLSQLHSPCWPVFLPAGPSAGQLAEATSFDWWPPQYVLDTVVGELADEAIWIFPGCRFRGRRVQTRCEPVFFEDFVQRHPQPGPGAEAGPRKPRAQPVRDDWRQALLQLHPWLTLADLGDQHVRRGCQPQGPRPPRRRPTAKPDDEVHEEDGNHEEEEDREQDEEMEEEEILELDEEELKDLVQREKDGFVFREDLDHFAARPLCGRWTVENNGVVADAAGGFVKNGVQKDWCTAYGFPKQAAFYFSRYGREGAGMLSREFVRRGNFFCDMFLQAECHDNFRYTQSDLDSYEPSDEFRDWMIEHEDVSAATFVRGDQLLKTFPTNPGEGGADP